MFSPTKHSVIVLTVSGAALVALSGCGGGTPAAAGSAGPPMSSMPGMTATASPAADSVDHAADITFAQDMLAHHRQAVVMSATALATPSASAQVRSLAQQITTEQNTEIATMTTWLKAWGAPQTAPSDGMSGMSGTTSSDSMSGMDMGSASASATAGGMSTGGMAGMSGMMSEADMESLKHLQGNAFDRTWLTMMTSHHQGAVTASQDVLKTTTDPQVRPFAQVIITEQQAQISTMQGLLGQIAG